MKISKVLTSIFAFAASAAAVFYIGIWFSRTFFESVTTDHAGMATIEQKISATGYVLRDEKVLTTTESGIVYHIVDEGEKVSKDSLVANIYVSEGLIGTQSKILEIDRKIAVLENSGVDKNFITSDISKLDQRIYDTLIDIKYNLLNSNYNLSAQEGDNLLTILNKRQLMSGKVDSFDENINQLEAEKSYMTHSLTGLKATVMTDKPGYFSAAVDGYENLFTKDKIGTMTVESFYDMIAQNPDETLIKSNAGKIITDYWWYILCPISKNECSDISVGKEYDIIFPYSSDVRVKFTLHDKITQTDRDEAILIFKTLAEPAGFDFSRSQDIQIVKNSYSGLRVLKTALRKIDDVEGVYILKGSTIEFRQVERIYESDGYYLMNSVPPAEKTEETGDGENILAEDNGNDENKPRIYSYLALYDSVIIKGKDLYDGKVIK